MKFDYIFIAIMFPAIPLMMSVFSNRFHTLSVLIRSMHDEFIYNKQSPVNLKKGLPLNANILKKLNSTIIFSTHRTDSEKYFDKSFKILNNKIIVN